MANYNFQCKYCSHHSTITDPDKFSQWMYIDMNKSTYGPIGFRIKAIKCPNSKCNELTIEVNLTEAVYIEDFCEWNWIPTKIIQEWKLLPESEAIVLPDYIPEPIKQDYYEACRIRDLSPKAAATLARRCLQGMIRDFFGISKLRLIDEIKAIKDKVDQNVYEAIEAVRQVGNIGAHMKKKIDMIIDVEPGEAQLLIELIEYLIEVWYVARKKDEDLLSKITALTKSKVVNKVENPFSDDLDEDVPF